MTPQEFEQLLHDGEIKLARLKALYEQWFQGIEKLEPSVARKDLERHFEMLKKNLPRNTALRFRTQQLVARYSTYGIYWSRIARQIEEGTFKRDLVKVAKRRGAVRERPKEQAWELDVDVELEEVAPLEEEGTDPGLLATAVPGRAAGKTPSLEPKKDALSFDDHDLDAILGTLSSQPPEAQKPKPARSISPFGFGRPVPGTASGPPASAAPTASPTPATGAGARPTPAAGAPAASATFGKPKDKAAPASSIVQPLGGAGAPVSAPVASPVASATTTGPHAAIPPKPAAIAPTHAAAVPTPAAAVPTPAAAVPTPTAAVPRPGAAAFPKPGGPVVPKPAVPSPATPTQASPARPVAAIPRPAAPAVVAPKPASPAPAASVPKPASPAPAAVAPKPAAAAAAAPRPAAGGNLDDRQMRAIYDRYVDARRQNNERTDVRFETLAESVQKMIPKLREKHGNKSIDFDVVVQNGKVGLKPKVG